MRAERREEMQRELHENKRDKDAVGASARSRNSQVTER